MNLTHYYSGLSIMVGGGVLWVVGVVLITLLPALGPIAAVLILFGQVLAVVGLLILVIQILVAAVRGHVVVAA